MCSESLGSEKVSYGPCAHQESCESLAAMAKFLVIRFDRISNEVHYPVVHSPKTNSSHLAGGRNPKKKLIFMTGQPTPLTYPPRNKALLRAY